MLFKQNLKKGNRVKPIFYLWYYNYMEQITGLRIENKIIEIIEINKSRNINMQLLLFNMIVNGDRYNLIIDGTYKELKLNKDATKIILPHIDKLGQLNFL